VSILVVVDIAVPNRFPHVSHLEPYSHHRGPLDVVGFGEGRPPAAGTDNPDNDQDPMMIMVPVRGERATPPVKAAISANPVATVGGMAVARAPTQSVVDASAPVWAAATVPLR
jgi:hypothetical protein